MQSQPLSKFFSPRTAGIIYLAIISLGIFGEGLVRSSLVVNNNAASTAQNIIGSQLLWRTGIATDLIMHVLDVPLLVFVYLLLRPISSPLAVLATSFHIVQTCILAANKLCLVAALFVISPPALAPPIVDSPALALLSIKLHSYGFAIGLIFFGCTCLIRGYLMFQSGYVPRMLGGLQFLAGLCYLINSFAVILSSSLASMLFPAVLVPALIAELAFALWLLFAKRSVFEHRRFSGEGMR